MNHNGNGRAHKGGNPLLDAALEYLQLGISVLPIDPQTKRPARGTRWKQFQEQRPNESQVRAWFANGRVKGLAIVLGPVSGGLCCRDFDQMPAYQRWADAHPELARTLPTVETGRPGIHVYFRADPVQIRRLSNSGDGGILPFDDGELRGFGCYCLAPPSLHKSGVQYRWLIPFPTGELPLLDVVAAGFVSGEAHATESTESTESNRDGRAGGEHRVLRSQPKNTEAIVEMTPVNLRDEPIQRAILESLPTAPGKRNNQVFQLARALKGIPALADAEPIDLRPIVEQWFELAKEFITTQEFEETWIDFLRAWPRVKFPGGTEPMAQILEKAKLEPLPDVAKRFSLSGLQLLIKLCRELQRAAGDGPFFLGCRTAGRLLGVEHTRAWRWLYLLVQEKVLAEVKKGSEASRKATRFRYIADS